MAKKLKDLGGKKWEKYSSIKSAQEAGSIYYSKGGKKMAAVLKGDLGKGQSLRSFMNEKLKGGANYKVKGIAKVRPKLRRGVIDPKGQNVGKDYETYPEKIAGISRSDMLKIIDSSKNPVKSKTISASNRREEAPTVKLQRRIEGARSAAEVREIVNNSGIKIPAAKMTALLGKLEKAGLFNFKPTKPKPSSKVEKPKPKNVQPESFVSKKPNRTITKSRKMSNAAVVKLFKEMYPSRLANIKIGDTVYFDPNRTNKQDNPAIVMIKSKGK